MIVALLLAIAWPTGLSVVDSAGEDTVNRCLKGVEGFSSHVEGRIQEQSGKRRPEVLAMFDRGIDRMMKDCRERVALGDANRRAESARLAAIRDKQEADAKADQETAEEVSRRLANPKTMQQIFSGALCQNDAIRKAAAEEIAREKKYARIGGGAVNLAKLYYLQKEMRAADDSTTATKRDMKAAGVSPMACSIPAVRSATSCFAREGCEDDAQIQLTSRLTMEPPDPVEQREDGDY